MQNLKELRRVTGAALCVECGKCSSMCPLTASGDFSAARTMSMHDPASEIGVYAEAVGRCLTCSSCEVRCPQGVRYTEYVKGLRGEVPTEWRRPRPHGEVFQMAARLSEESSRPSRPAWLREDLQTADEGEVALFVGCLPIFDEVFGDDLQVETVAIARAAVRLLNRVGITPVLVGEERCCGHDLLWGGEQAAFESLARANLEHFRQRGIQRILTVCAECCRTWRVDYAELATDYRPQVQHITEVLAPKLAEGLAFRAAGNGKVTYQDPCRLGRQLGVLDEPRTLLAAIPESELLEMERAGQDAQCCGTSGFVHCDAVSRHLQRERLRDAAATGASKLLTACPKCLLHFRCAQSEDRRRSRPSPPIEVEDLTVYLDSRLAPSRGPAADSRAETSQTGERS